MHLEKERLQLAALAAPASVKHQAVWAPAAVCRWLGREGAGLGEGKEVRLPDPFSLRNGAQGRKAGRGWGGRGGTVAVIHKTKIINDLKNTLGPTSTLSPMPHPAIKQRSHL